VPPDVAWAPPEPAAGAVTGPKLLVPEEPLVSEEPVEPELALGELAEGVAALADADADGDGAGARVVVPDGAGLAVACADPGRVMATAPVAMTLAAATVVVTERILA
jgi:hypothetical protein